MEKLDVYCSNGKCPICEKQLHKIGFDTKCANNCFFIESAHFRDGERYTIGINFIVFDKIICFQPGFSFSKVIYEENQRLIEDEVNFWKEDYKYLVKILEER